MKYTLVIPQAGVVQAGLVGRVDLPELCLLDYLSGWFFSKAARKVTVEGREYTWVNGPHAVEELPLLFNPGATLSTRRNQLSRLVQRLREVGLVESVKVGRDLYLRPTDLASSLGSTGRTTVSNPHPALTPSRDDTITLDHDDTITPQRDDGTPAVYTETGTMNTTNETPPPSPLQGEAAEVVAFWNAHSQLPQVLRLTPRRAKALHRRLAEPFFAQNWRAGIDRVAKSGFCTGHGPRGWRANLDFLLRPDTLTKIMEGQYDRHPGSPATRATPPRHFQDADYNQPTANL